MPKKYTLAKNVKTQNGGFWPYKVNMIGNRSILGAPLMQQRTRTLQLPLANPVKLSTPNMITPFTNSNIGPFSQYGPTVVTQPKPAFMTQLAPLSPLSQLSPLPQLSQLSPLSPLSPRVSVGVVRENKNGLNMRVNLGPSLGVGSGFWNTGPKYYNNNFNLGMPTHTPLRTPDAIRVTNPLTGRSVEVDIKKPVDDKKTEVVIYLTISDENTEKHLLSMGDSFVSKSSLPSVRVDDVTQPKIEAAFLEKYGFKISHGPGEILKHPDTKTYPNTSIVHVKTTYKNALEKDDSWGTSTSTKNQNIAKINKFWQNKNKNKNYSSVILNPINKISLDSKGEQIHKELNK